MNRPRTPTYQKVIWAVVGIVVVAAILKAVIDPELSMTSSCSAWLGADAQAQMDNVDFYVSEHSEARDTDEWKKSYAHYVTVACEARETDSELAPDSVEENLDDAVEVSRPT